MVDKMAEKVNLYINKVMEFDYLLNTLLLTGLQVNTSTIDIVANPINFRIKTTTTDFLRIEIAAMIVTLISITNEQNWPRNVMTFLSFLCRITDGSKMRLSSSELSCLYRK